MNYQCIKDIVVAFDLITHGLELFYCYLRKMFQYQTLPLVMVKGELASTCYGL